MDPTEEARDIVRRKGFENGRSARGEDSPLLLIGPKKVPLFDREVTLRSRTYHVP